MKDLFNLGKSKLLFFVLLACFAGGVSPAWAETLTANFNRGVGLPEGWSIVGDLTNDDTRARSGYGVWTSSKSDNANYLVTEPVEGTITFYARAYNKNSAAYVFIYAYDGTTLGEQLYTTGTMRTSSTPTFSSYTADLGSYKGQVAIALNYAAIDDVTYTQKAEPILGPAFKVLDGTKELTTGYEYSFGLATAGTAKTFTLSNPGTEDLAVSVAETGNFGATLSAETIAAGSEVTLTLTMPAATGSSEVTITPDAASGIEPFVINVSGVMRDESKYFEPLTGGAKPDGWSTAGSWSFASGYAYTSAWYQSSDARLITPMLEVKSGESIIFEAMGTYEGYESMVVEYSTDKTTWTASSTTLTLTSDWALYTISDIPAGRYFIALHASQARVRNFYGCEVVVGANFAINTDGTTQNFGNVKANTTVEKSFTVTNGGNAPLTITFAADGDFSVVGELSLTVAAGGSESFTIAMDTATPGTKSGNVVLTFDALNATSFTIPCTGSVKDPNLLEIDFEDGAMPEGWQVGTDWRIGTASGNKYAYQNNTKTASALVTTPLTVADGETLTFKAARNASGYGYVTSLKVRYSVDGGTNWSDYTNYAIESSGLTAMTLTGVPAGTAIIEFLGSNIKLDDIEGFLKAVKPAMAVTEEDAAVATGDVKDFGFLNADGTATYTVKNIGNATLKATVVGEGITVSPATIELAAGATADLAVTMKYEAPYGDRTGMKMTIDAEDEWISDFVVNFKANLVDPDAFVEDFTAGKPAGWYNGGWSFSGGVATISEGTAKEMITKKLEAAEGRNVLSFKAKYNSEYLDKTINVYTSADRKNWSDAQSFTLTREEQTFSLDALADGTCYVKFEAANATVDDVQGLKNVALPDHDMFIVSATLPADEITPIDTYTARVNVASLRADENVTAELYFGDTKVAIVEKTITAGATEAIEISGNAPAAGEYEVLVKVLAGDINLETEKVNVKVADKTELSLTGFAAVAKNVTADADNMFTAEFTVTVKNTGSTAFPAGVVTVTITDGDNNALETAAWNPGEATLLEAGMTATINVTVTAPAGDGGEFEFNAKENVSNVYWYPTHQGWKETVKVTAAPTIVISETGNGTFATGTNRKVRMSLQFVEGWNTICVPFALDATDIHADAKALEFTAYDAATKELTFSPVETLEANKPYVVYVPANVTEAIDFVDKTVTESSELGVTFNDVTFQGTYAPKDAGSLENSWGLTAEGRIVKAGENTTIRGFRAYFDGVPEGATACFIGFDDTTTGISTTQMNRVGENSELYNLQGQKVERLNKSGLYIVNGKKVVVK